MVTHQVNGDSQQPGVNPAIAPKAAQLLVGAKEALLREHVCKIIIPDQEEDHPINPPLMQAHELVEALRSNDF